MRVPLIFDIKQFATHDGPGIRVTVFFKGCALSCKWCHNPESIPKQQQKMYSYDKCIGCMECVKQCPNNALKLTPKGIQTDINLCDLQGKCVDVCPSGAMEMTGVFMSVEQIMDQIKKDTLVMDTSGGGVTFSGGEPLLYHDFLLELLEACGGENIHRCVDTTGYADKEILIKVAEKTDLFLYDLKIMDSDKHKKWTGVPNKKILENLQVLASRGKHLIIRIPLIKGVNDDDDSIDETAKFISKLDGESPVVNILPYHNLATKKYEKLGQHYDSGLMEEPEEEQLKKALKIFESYGVKARIGG